MKRTTVWIAVLANVPVLLLLLVSSYSDHLTPASFPLLSISGLLFPVALAATLLLLVAWLLFYWRGALIPVAALLLCLPAIRLYVPINRTQDIPDDAIKVMSYNVLMFAPWDLPDKEKNPIIEYILGQDADIVCLQEASAAEVGGESVVTKLYARYPYRNSVTKRGGEWISLYSKFPILSVDTIVLEETNNMAMAYVLKTGSEETLVVNCHLQTVGLSYEEKHDFKRMVENQMDDEEAKSATRSLLRKLRDASVRRAAQAETVAELIAGHRAKGRSVIVCGDFNDTPLSYTHRTIGKGLTDCYAATGSGPGYTYQQDGMHVRIDHIFCSDDWTPFGARVDKEVDTSDHFPVVCWLKKRPKE